MRPINYFQYSFLNQACKLQVLDARGVYLDLARYEGFYKICLFDLDGFYVEVWLHERTGALKKVNAFRNLKRLEPYLDMIPIGLQHEGHEGFFYQQEQ